MARRGRRKKLFNFKLKKETLYSMGSVFFFALGGLIPLSFFYKELLLGYLYSQLTGLVGWCIIFLPFIFIVAGLLLAKIEFILTKPTILVGSLLIFVSLLGVSHAGKAGLEIWLSLSSLISAPGAVIILFGAFVVGLIVFFETSIEEIIMAVKNVLAKTTNSLPKVSGNLNVKLIGNSETEDKKNEKTSEKQESDLKREQKPVSPQALPDVPGSQIKVWEYPPLSLLSNATGGKADRGNTNRNAGIIKETLESFGINAEVVEVNGGPAVTQYCLKIAIGTKLSKITSLANDLALALAAPTGQIRIEAPIPGKSLVGIEIPNMAPEFVTLRHMLSSQVMKKAKSKLTVAMGLDVSGQPVVADIDKMPHILIAGATGSGKSVCINSFIASILFRASPSEVKFIMVDPKRVELTQYNDIPHILTPVITEPEKVLGALKWAIGEMENRYKQFASVGVRNIQGYNELAGFQALPYIIIVVDELADIMLFAPSEVEDSITRLAQMARATGIHLIVSTQRPSVNVITGLIKANIPARIAFNVSSMIDSRVIIDMPGAEKLLGRGDMLFIPPEQAKPTRIQGAFVSDHEINQLINFLRQSGLKPQYSKEITATTTKLESAESSDKKRDPLFEDAARIICQYDRASASLLQRKLSIGYSRAAKILDQLEANAIVGKADGSKPREVLIKNVEEFFASAHNN